MANQGVRIVTTDGEEIQQVGFINVSSQRIVAGQVTPSEERDLSHTTYHSNGFIQKKLEPGHSAMKKYPKFYGPCLSDFSGYVVIDQGSLPPSPEVGKLISPEFDIKEDTGFDSIAHIDNRNAEYGMSWRIFVCEPGYPISPMVENAINQNQEVNEKLNDEGQPGISIHTFTGTDPWTGVISAPGSRLHRIPNYTQNFRPMDKNLVSRCKDVDQEVCPSGAGGCDGPNGAGPLCMGCYENYIR